MRRGSSSDLLPQGLGELQDRPASLDGESAEPGVGDAVLDLACRSDRTVEAQVVGDALDDLLQ